MYHEAPRFISPVGVVSLKILAAMLYIIIEYIMSNTLTSYQSKIDTIIIIVIIRAAYYACDSSSTVSWNWINEKKKNNETTRMPIPRGVWPLAVTIGILKSNHRDCQGRHSLVTRLIHRGEVKPISARVSLRMSRRMIDLIYCHVTSLIGRCSFTSNAKR